MTNCGSCNGTGKRIVRHYDGTRFLRAGYKICPACGGRGETYLVPKGDYSDVLESERKRIKK